MDTDDKILFFNFNNKVEKSFYAIAQKSVLTGSNRILIYVRENSFK